MQTPGYDAHVVAWRDYLHTLELLDAAALTPMLTDDEPANDMTDPSYPDALLMPALPPLPGDLGD
jgi:hypothetical protein